METMDSKTIMELDEKYVLPTYGRNPVALVRGKGLRAWDAEGKEYLDFTSGIGVNSLGFCHPAWTAAVAAQAGALQHISNLYVTAPDAKLAKKLFKRYNKLPARRQAEKVRQGLAANGYAADLFNEIKDTVTPQPDLEQEDELLAKEAAKVWRRYEKRVPTDYERRLKVKQALYRKGFDLDEAEHWLNEHAND